MPNDWGSYQQLSAIKDVQASLDRIKTNDLAHINTRLNKMDIKLASMGTSLSWLTKLAVVLTGAMVAGTVAVVLKYLGII
jgi:uncharacterized protein YbaP (TraB family)